MSSPIRIIPNYTYDDYANWEGRWELIDGIPFSKRLEFTPAHQLVNTNLGAAVYFALKSFKQYKAYPSTAYKVEDHTIFQPGLLIASKRIEKNFLDFLPLLVAEILSPETAIIDRHKKFDTYQEQGIPYYLIVSPETEETEVYVFEEGIYKLRQKAVSFNYTFHLDEACEITIDFSEIWK